ncbi:MAG: hypothetical protein S0880_28605 [Actinomycetota bacterium]|nr:hypothetical protein [Actinomycetota bacterium]
MWCFAADRSGQMRCIDEDSGEEADVARRDLECLPRSSTTALQCRIPEALRD